MKYCDIHKDLSDEEGDECPLCRCMQEKCALVERLGSKIKDLKSMLTKAIEVVEDKIVQNPWPPERGGFASGCQFCGKPYPTTFRNEDYHYDNCSWLKAADLFPELRKLDA